MKTRCRRGTWSSSEYRGRARVAHAVAHDELSPADRWRSPLTCRGLKRTWLANLKEVQDHEQR